jgi:hypothetical protein
MVKCKLCGRKLKAKLSKKRGYGPVCWEKVVKEEQPTDNQYEEKIQQLESQIKNLTMIVNSIRTNTTLPPPPPNNGSSISILQPEYSISELTSNPLYLKMQKIANNS